jgi:hypothetical protein
MMRDIHRRIEKLGAEVPQQPPWELKAARAYVEIITLPSHLQNCDFTRNFSF